MTPPRRSRPVASSTAGRHQPAARRAGRPTANVDRRPASAAWPPAYEPPVSGSPGYGQQPVSGGAGYGQPVSGGAGYRPRQRCRRLPEQRPARRLPDQRRGPATPRRPAAVAIRRATRRRPAPAVTGGPSLSCVPLVALSVTLVIAGGGDRRRRAGAQQRLGRRRTGSTTPSGTSGSAATEPSPTWTRVWWASGRSRRTRRTCRSPTSARSRSPAARTRGSTATTTAPATTNYGDGTISRGHGEQRDDQAGDQRHRSTTSSPPATAR